MLREVEAIEDVGFEASVLNEVGAGAMCWYPLVNILQTMENPYFNIF